MKSDNKSLVVPVLLIAIGTGWLLSKLEIAPKVDWCWSLGIGAIGVLSIVVGGIDKVTIVVGPLFIAASVISILRQTDLLTLDIEIPLLMILGGVLMLIARRTNIPVPSWIIQEPGSSP